VLPKFYGAFYIGKSTHLPSYGYVFEDEVFSMLDSIHTPISTGTHSVVFEIESKTLAHAINSTYVHINEFGDIVSQGYLI